MRSFGRCLALLGVIGVWAAGSLAPAQIQLSVRTENRNNFLLYERVDLLVSVTNMGEEPLVLDNDDAHSWLTFLVSRHAQHNFPIRPEHSSKFPTLTLKPGENQTLRINLTPLFSFREEGDYRASAVVNLPTQSQIISEPVPFTVCKGNKVWSQSRPVEQKNLVYSLIRFSPNPESTSLYLRVESPDDNVVLSNLALGRLASLIDPDALFDPRGNLHVLQPIALGTYLYTRADSNGKILDQRLFKSTSVQDISGPLRIPPRLTKLNDGNVFVAGGVIEAPNAPREKLSEAQAQAVKKNSGPGDSLQ